MPQMPFLASILVIALRVVALQDPAPPAGQQQPAPAQAGKNATHPPKMTPCRRFHRARNLKTNAQIDLITIP